MKRNLLSMFAVAAGLLMATSCSTKQEEEVTTGGEAVVTFTAQLPSGVNSRAPQKTTDGGDAATTTFGKGTKATRLQYAVYKVGKDGGWTEVTGLSNETTINLTASVSLQLVKGNTYAVAFWADAPTTDTQNPIYSFNKTDCKITADYTKATSSDEDLDAFYAVTKEFTVNGSAQQTIELKRPFAQLNIGTADLTAYKTESGKEIQRAGIKVKVQNILNLKSGELEGEATDVTFDLAALPEDEKFPVDGYTYLTMNYLLMPKDKQADNEVTIIYDDESGALARTFTNVPLQRNYLTNIYGNLLTSTTTFNVEIKPEFGDKMEESDKTFSVAEGKVVKFSKGNLQYAQDKKEWSFADHQYDFIGAANATAEGILANKIDLFGWSGNNTTAQWGISISKENKDYSGDFVDWGNNMAGYRTLTHDEWTYLLNTRANASERKGIARINISEDGTQFANGLILLPDVFWSCPTGVTFRTGFTTSTSKSPSQDYAAFQILTLAQWEELEKAGAVFLPASGMRTVNAENTSCVDIWNVDTYGCYWSASANGTTSAYNMYVSPTEFPVNYMYGYRYGGCAVRLVKDFKK